MTARKGAAKPKAKATPRKAASPKLAAAPSVARVALARQLLPQARPILLRYPNVRGVGVGLRRCGVDYTGEVAFVVSVDQKDDPKRPRLNEHQRLPSQLLGFPVDVQQLPQGRLKVDVRGGGEVRRQGRASGGHIGFVAKHQSGSVHALTAMHVFDKNLVVLPPGPNPHFDVEARMDAIDFCGIGKLRAGGFGIREDLANVCLDAGVGSARELFGTTVVLGAPVKPQDLPATLNVMISVPGQNPLRGHLAGYPVDQEFPTANGFLMFHDLMHFRITGTGIQQGWSGSVIFDPAAKRPLALLSFGSDGVDADGFSHAWGFPLAAHYEAWGLSPL